MKAWARALRSLQRHPSIWRGRINATLIDRYLALTAEARVDELEQQTLTLE